MSKELTDFEKWRSSFSCSLYKPEYAEMLLDHLSQGFSLGSFSVQRGVSYNTIKNWLNKHPEFAEAREMGERNRLKLLEEEGLKMVKAGNVQAWKFLMGQMGFHEKIRVEDETPTTISPPVGSEPYRYQRLQRLKELHQRAMAEKNILEAEFDDLEDL